MIKLFDFKLVVFCVLILGIALKKNNKYHVTQEEFHVFVHRNGSNMTEQDIAFINTYKEEANHDLPGRERHPSFHSFPPPDQYKVRLTNEFGLEEIIDRRTTWEKVLKSKKKITTHTQVCSLHFRKEDFFPALPYMNKLLNCPILKNEMCTTRLWGQDKFNVTTGIFNFGDEAIFDRRWPVLHNRCTGNDTGKLVHLSSTNDSAEFTMFFRVKAQCGVHFFVCDSDTPTCYRFLFKDCANGSSTVKKCEIHIANAEEQTHHLNHLCKEPLEHHDILGFKPPNSSTWMNFKLIKKENEFQLKYVNGSGENLIYKVQLQGWNGARLFYGSTKKSTCWKLPDYTFLVTNTQETVEVGPQVDVDEICFYMFVLMTTQEGLKIEIASTKDPEKVFFEKIVHNRKPYTWNEVLIAVSNITGGGSNVNVTPILSRETYTEDFWGIDYITECHMRERKLITIYDYSESGSSLDYKDLRIQDETVIVHEADVKNQTLVYCSVSSVSDHCVPYEWVFRNDSRKLLGQEFGATYACKCPEVEEGFGNAHPWIVFGITMACLCLLAPVCWGIGRYVVPGDFSFLNLFVRNSDQEEPETEMSNLADIPERRTSEEPSI